MMAYEGSESTRDKDRILSGASTPGQSEPVNNDNEEILRFPQISSSTGTSPSDCLVSHAGHS